MNLENFVKEYQEYIKEYGELENGIIFLEISPKEKTMWLKRMVFEKLEYQEFTASHNSNSNTIWFEPKK